MEYIYLLQREMDKQYNVFKAGRATSIKKRLDAADYRRADVYLVRGVSDSSKCEEEIFKTLADLRFVNARLYYNNINDDRMYNQFGLEDYIIKDNIYEVVEIINKICDKYKYSFSNSINVNLNLLNNSTNNNNSINNIDYSNVNLNSLNNSNEIDRIQFNNLPEFNNNSQIQFSGKVKVDYEHFKKIFTYDKLIYIVKDRQLFELYYKNKIDISSNMYSIETITNITEIIYDRLYLKRSPRITSHQAIHTPYLTQVIKIDKLMLVGINTSNIYNPLEIKFYVPNNAFENEINDWEIDGVLENPIKLRMIRSHGYNCYSFN